MQYFGFLVFRILVVPLAYLPLRVLYVLSTFFYLILYYVAGYRREVVYNNLKKSFPEKTEAELRSIEKQFYKNLCDLIIETIKFFKMSKNELRERFQFPDEHKWLTEYNLGRDIVLVGGHFNNHEWAAQRLNLSSPHMHIIGLFTPLSNPYFNTYLLKNRQRYGIEMIPAAEASKQLSEPSQEKRAIGFVADQCPRPNPKNYWTNFLNQETAVFTGVERYAIQLNAPVIFCYPLRIRRGYYSLHLKMLSDEPQLAHPLSITETHVRWLEKLIQEHPADWMWSHKRWKLKKEQK